jgi:hypothetical protein
LKTLVRKIEGQARIPSWDQLLVPPGYARRRRKMVMASEVMASKMTKMP